MKKLLVLIAFVLPLSAFAGPEDWKPVATYVADNTQVPYQLLAFNFDAAEINAEGTKLTLSARYGNLATGEYTLTKYSAHNEDKNNFVAEKTIINKWDAGCGAGEIAKVIVSGQEFKSLPIPVEYLTIQVQYTTTVDTCHSRPQTQLINYTVAQ